MLPTNAPLFNLCEASRTGRPWSTDTAAWSLANMRCVPRSAGEGEGVEEDQAADGVQREEGAEENAEPDEGSLSMLIRPQSLSCAFARFFALPERLMRRGPTQAAGRAAIIRHDPIPSMARISSSAHGLTGSLACAETGLELHEARPCSLQSFFVKTPPAEARCGGCSPGRACACAGDGDAGCGAGGCKGRHGCRA